MVEGVLPAARPLVSSNDNIVRAVVDDLAGSQWSVKVSFPLEDLNREIQRVALLEVVIQPQFKGANQFHTSSPPTTQFSFLGLGACSLLECSVSLRQGRGTSSSLAALQHYEYRRRPGVRFAGLGAEAALR